MKISLSYSILAACVCLSTAFSPVQVSRHHASFQQKSWSARRMSSEETEESLEQEVERMVKEEVRIKKKISNLRNANGVEYAPWMNISREEEAKIRTLMREKAEARRRRQEQEQDVQGALLVDSQAQELSGTGLKSKIIDGNSVALEWATASEAYTDGFLIKRRAAKVDKEFQVIANLASQGSEGGLYQYLDEELPPGGYFYRVTECETGGAENDLSQCLVEIQTVEEQRGALFAGIGVAVLLVATVVAGIVLDPMQ